MQGTVRIQIRWPADLASRLQELASQRRTTFAELVRQAVIDHYSLAGNDTNLVMNGKNGVETESHS